MDLPNRLLPDSLEELSLKEVREAARATARLIDRSHHDLGRALRHIREEGSLGLGYRSVIDFAEAELGLGRRAAYHLMRVEELTLELPKVREAYARGEVSYSNVRTIVQIAEPDDEERWLELAKQKSYRELNRAVKAEAHERAEKGQAAWPETGLYGELGRPDPVRRELRPYNGALLELEATVWELHNRFSGCDTSWAEFFEAAIVSYWQELDLAARVLEPQARETLERDGWRCRAPHCARRANLHSHHVVFRSQGGSDNPEQICTLCAQHHRAVHEGLLLVEGSASKGFRFAHRESPGDRWEYWPDDAGEPLPCDPHTMAPDLEHAARVSALRRRDRTWAVRSRPPRYGGRVLSAMPGCERADTGRAGSRSWRPGPEAADQRPVGRILPAEMGPLPS